MIKKQSKQIFKILIQNKKEIENSNTKTKNYLANTENKNIVPYANNKDTNF